MILSQSRDDLRAIFQPVIEEISRLIAEQISKVRAKRLQEKHTKTADIKVSIAYRCTGVFDGERQYSWLAALDPTFFCEIQ